MSVMSALDVGKLFPVLISKETYFFFQVQIAHETLVEVSSPAQTM